MSIGQQIKDRRKAKGIRQTTLAKSVGITQEYLSKIENGKKKCSLELTLKMFSILGIKLENTHLIELGNSSFIKNIELYRTLFNFIR